MESAGLKTENSIEGLFSGLILDMDGVLYRGQQALPGARELFHKLRAHGISFIMLTNNATLTSEDFANKLARMEIEVSPDLILTSAGATAIFLEENHPEGGSVYVVGEAGLVSYMSGMPQFQLTDENPRFVVSGLDYDFNYTAMRIACTAIRRGAHFIATNTDATLPVEGGELWPGAGSIAASIEACAGVAPTVIGKPNVYMAEMALKRLDLPASRVLCVGDRLETDILCGARSGIPTAMVLTGVSQLSDLAGAEAQPTYVFEDLYQLMSAMGVDRQSPGYVQS
jgi:4-nitrophenyl phosphatase